VVPIMILTDTLRRIVSRWAAVVLKRRREVTCAETIVQSLNRATRLLLRYWFVPVFSRGTPTPYAYPPREVPCICFASINTLSLSLSHTITPPRRQRSFRAG